jgi:hypothetical protein
MLRWTEKMASLCFDPSGYRATYLSFDPQSEMQLIAPTVSCKKAIGFGFVIALRPQTPKRIRGGWSHYTDTSKPVDGGVGTLQL